MLNFLSVYLCIYSRVSTLNKTPGNDLGNDLLCCRYSLIWASVNDFYSSEVKKKCSLKNLFVLKATQRIMGPLQTDVRKKRGYAKCSLS